MLLTLNLFTGPALTGPNGRQRLSVELEFSGQIFKLRAVKGLGLLNKITRR